MAPPAKRRLLIVGTTSWWNWIQETDDNTSLMIWQIHAIETARSNDGIAIETTSQLDEGIASDEVVQPPRTVKCYCTRKHHHDHDRVQPLRGLNCDQSTCLSSNSKQTYDQTLQINQSKLPIDQTVAKSSSFQHHMSE